MLLPLQKRGGGYPSLYYKKFMKLTFGSLRGIGISIFFWFKKYNYLSRTGKLLIRDQKPGG